MLLAIDTSTRAMGIALFDGAQILGELVWASREYHSSELAPAVTDMLTRARIAASHLRAIGVAIGPGSFTGLRIGLALAKGIALTGHQALIGVPTLDILAAAQPAREASLLAVLRAGRGRLAVGSYQLQAGRWQMSAAVEAFTFEEMLHRLDRPTVVCGELTEEERRVLEREHKAAILASPAQCVRRPAVLAELAWQRWKAGKTDDPATLSPFYLG